MAAARAIAAIVTDDELHEDYIIPSVFNRDVAPAVAAAVADEARASGTALAGSEVGFAQGDAADTCILRVESSELLRKRWIAVRVTVTGASGLIGSALVAELGERGAEVTVLSRDPSRAREAAGGRGGALGSARRAGPGRGAGGCGRGRAPGRGERRPALERAGQAGDPRQPRARHPQSARGVGGGQMEGAAPAVRPGRRRTSADADQRLGDRLLRRARRRAARRGRAPGERLPRGDVRGLGGRGAAGRGAGDARGAGAHRRGARTARAARCRRCCRRSGSASAGRWRAASSTCPGSTARISSA